MYGSILLDLADVQFHYEERLDTEIEIDGWLNLRMDNDAIYAKMRTIWKDDLPPLPEILGVTIEAYADDDENAVEPVYEENIWECSGMTLTTMVDLVVDAIKAKGNVGLA